MQTNLFIYLFIHLFVYLGPSIKYVTLQGGGGLRKCDSLWRGRGLKIMWLHTVSFFDNSQFNVLFDILSYIVQI